VQGWEYMTIDGESFTPKGSERFLAKLNEAGKNGWRVVLMNYPHVRKWSVLMEREVPKSQASMSDKPDRNRW